MLNALLFQTVAGPAAEARRHAYNAAFEELGLTWHWDAATYARLQAHGSEAVRIYLKTEQPHLLRAYEADFLVNAIETIQARCFADMGNRGQQAPYLQSGELHSDGSARNQLAGARQHMACSASVQRTAASAAN